MIMMSWSVCFRSIISVWNKFENIAGRTPDDKNRKSMQRVLIYLSSAIIVYTHLELSESNLPFVSQFVIPAYV